MSLVTRLSDAFTAVGTAIKATRTLLNGNAADNSALTTTAKNNLVAAINEINAKPTGGVVNDASAASATETWSINKIKSEDAANRSALKAEILGAAGAAYDTLEELKAYADSGQAADQVALANRLRTDTNQGLTAPQKQQARDNIDVYSKVEIGNPETDLVAVFTAALA